MSIPTFRKQASVWSLSDTCFVIPQYGDTNPDLIPPLVSQARSMFSASTPVQIQITATKKYIASGAATTTNPGCPTGDVPPPTNPLTDAIVKCQSQPPYTDALPTRMTVLSSGDSPLVPTTESDYPNAINSAPVGTGFWVLWDDQDNVYLVTFPPPALPLPQAPPAL